MSKSKSILITGGAGFIGSRLCEKLFDIGYNITVMDNLSSQIHGNGESFLFNRIKDKCIFINGDVRNKNDWKKAIKDQEIIVHLAAETGTGQSMYEIEKYNEVNIMGTAYMLELLSSTNHKVKKIVKEYVHDGIRTHSLQIRSLTRYPVAPHGLIILKKI